MKISGINKETKGTLAILIREISDIIDNEPTYYRSLSKIDTTLRSWIRANDLHPEEVVQVHKGSSKIVKA